MSYEFLRYVSEVFEHAKLLPRGSKTIYDLGLRTLGRLRHTCITLASTYENKNMVLKKPKSFGERDVTLVYHVQKCLTFSDLNLSCSKMSETHLRYT